MIYVSTVSIFSSFNNVALLYLHILYQVNYISSLTTEKCCHKCYHIFNQWENKTIVFPSAFAPFPWALLKGEKTNIVPG